MTKNTKSKATPSATPAPAKVKASSRAGEDAILAKYSNVVAGSLSFIEGDGVCSNADVPSEYAATHRNKQVVQINTVGTDGQPDGNIRWVATSDLHQVTTTPEVKKELRAMARRAKAQAKRDAAPKAVPKTKTKNAKTKSADVALAEEMTK